MLIECPSAYVVDGDSLRCGDIRLRLLGIDAPELHNCPRWVYAFPAMAPSLKPVSLLRCDLGLSGTRWSRSIASAAQWSWHGLDG